MKMKMKKFEEIIKLSEGYSLEEAIENAQMQLHESTAVSNMTGVFSRSEFKQPMDFIKDYVNTDNFVQNKIYYINLVKPVDNSKLKPFKVDHIPSGERRGYKIGYMAVGIDSNKIYGVKNSKPEAVSLAKEKVAETQEDISIIVTKQVYKGSPETARVLFSPSKNMKMGKFILFQAGEPLPNEKPSYDTITENISRTAVLEEVNEETLA